MDFLHTIGGMLPADLSAGRMLESDVLLAIIWRKLRPHLDAIEKRLGGLEDAVNLGFANGESRFKTIERRIHALEKPTVQGGTVHGETALSS